MDEELEIKVFAYVAMLEDINQKLLTALKECVELLSQFKPSVMDPEGWQEMLDDFQEVIRLGEREIVGERRSH